MWYNIYFSEEVILAEERTTEEEKMHILEGPYNVIPTSWIFTFIKLKRFARRARSPKRSRAYLYRVFRALTSPLLWRNLWRMDFSSFFARKKLRCRTRKESVILINWIEWLTIISLILTSLLWNEPLFLSDCTFVSYHIVKRNA